MKKFLNLELFLTILIRFGSVGIGAILIRMFSDRDALGEWGVITMVIAYSSIIVLFTQFGQGVNILKQDEVDSKYMLNVQLTSLFLSLIPVSLGWALMSFIPRELYMAFMMAPIFVWFRNFSFFFQRPEYNKLLFSLLNKEAYLYITLMLVVLGFYFSSLQIEFYLPIAIVVMSFGPIIYYLVNLKKGIKVFSIAHSKNNLKLSLPFFIASSSAVVLSWTDTIMLGGFKGEEVVGIYNGIFKISSLITISLSLLNSFVAPRIRNAHNNGGESLQLLVKPYNRMGFLLSVVSYLAIVFFANYAFQLLGLPESDEMYYALIVLAFGYVVNAAVGNVGFLLQLTGNHSVFNKIVLMALALNITLNFALIPSYGIMGAAIASTISMSFWNVLSFFAVKNKLGFSPI